MFSCFVAEKFPPMFSVQLWLLYTLNQLFDMQQTHQTVMLSPPHGAGGLVKGLCPLRQARQS